MGQDARTCHPTSVCARYGQPPQFEIRAPKVFRASERPIHSFSHFCPNAALQPAVETPVHDSPLAQRVREEGASIFQGFSFERPSLLQRRRNRPHRKPVEDCFHDIGRASEADSAVQTCSMIDSMFGNGSVAAASDVNRDCVISSSRPFEACQTQWFDVPPPDHHDAPRPASPTDYSAIEDEILGGGRLKLGTGMVGSRPKVSLQMLHLLAVHMTLFQGRTQFLYIIYQASLGIDIRFFRL